ncbi:hypothetical protein SAMN04488506_0591 [Desemzia incerta]|uniref:DUF4352 domain-containing protein n=1 Tax=Desemzia incerta TaxID=82801 RepID=A0A1I5VU24_9LACT|nr:hypothetical protein [Desemzia incerta]SFQ10999.1 hypothetical protein SAMN04488506_0591 [Desemzia incerta]
MKKIVGGLLLSLSAVTLMACSGGLDNTGKETSKDSNAATSSSAIEPVDENYVEKGKLLEVGQWTDDEGYGGKITLAKLASPKETIQILDGFSILINDIKILEYSEVDQNLLESDVSDGFIPENSLTEDGFYTIQIDYVVTNDTDNALDFYGLNYIVTDQGQQIDVMMDNLNYSNTTTFQPNTKVEDYIVAPINAEAMSDLSKVTLTTSELWDESDGSQLVDEKSIEVNFN